MRRLRDSIEASQFPRGLSQRQVFKVAAAFGGLVREVDELGEEIEWWQQLCRTSAISTWTFPEQHRARLLVDLLLSLETPLKRYFEVMPTDEGKERAIAIGAADEEYPEEKRLDANLKAILHIAEGLKSAR
jgi:hypothetical protein